MIKALPRFFLVITIVASGLFLLAPASQATVTTYSQTFNSGTLSSSSSQAIAWDSFRASLTGTYDQIVMTSTNNSFSLTLTSNTVVTQVATALRTGTFSNFTISVKQI